jgi:adenosylcobinamide kinase / adenosylcobinamide-phosphate guanylyltransferase
MEHVSTFPLPPVTLVLGGARSGKSTHAEKLVTGSLFGAVPRPAVYIATAEAGDVEMATRIMAHRTRRGAAWTTIEEPLKLAEALEAAAAHGQPVLVDCLTLWLSNIVLAERDPTPEADRLVQAVRRAQGPLILVSNEVGHGIVPSTPLGRMFRDEQGRLNQRIAEACDAVVFVAAGCPILLKPSPPLQLHLE